MQKDASVSAISHPDLYDFKAPDVKYNNGKYGLQWFDEHRNEIGIAVVKRGIFYQTICFGTNNKKPVKENILLTKANTLDSN